MVIVCRITVLAKLVLNNLLFFKMKFLFFLLSKFKLQQFIKTFLYLLIFLWKLCYPVFCLYLLHYRLFRHLCVLGVDLCHLILVIKTCQWIYVLVSLKSFPLLINCCHTISVCNWARPSTILRIPHISLSLDPLLPPLTTRTIFLGIWVIDKSSRLLFSSHDSTYGRLSIGLYRILPPLYWLSHNYYSDLTYKIINLYTNHLFTVDFDGNL